MGEKKSYFIRSYKSRNWDWAEHRFQTSKEGYKRTNPAPAGFNT